MPLQNNETLRMLLAQQHRIRLSDGVERDLYFIFCAGTAFMLIAPDEFPEKAQNKELFDRIERFVQIHRNCFLLLQSPVYGIREWEAVSAVHNRFFGSNLKVLPVHSTGDIVKAMLTIAKATSKPHIDSLWDRLSLARAHVIELSSVWELLHDMQLLSDQSTKEDLEIPQP
ncbi:hypothetical protein P4O66_009779 [Electrophorus voltai]|uniref:Uncharacterized protein n=1 Tax=Electrophorus voltai TaxID=2609070 RepID=A0AAD8ZFT2_9TELE|nr:hypothetical protein P4O66_009779 [Electrophorus voltai]